MRTGTITNSKCQRRVGTVADLLVECLEKEGVRFVFGVPGEETDALLSALAESSITFVALSPRARVCVNCGCLGDDL
jgi:hypothetical protein